MTETTAGDATAMVEPRFEEIGDDEISAVVDLWMRCGLTRPWNDPVADLRLARESGHGAVVVARLGGRLAGAAMIGHDGHRGALYYLAVDPDLRRCGLGRRLVEFAEAWCRARGVPKLNLLVRRENSVVLAFYEALGFADTGSLSLSHTLDPQVAAVEKDQKRAWAAKLAARS